MGDVGSPVIAYSSGTGPPRLAVPENACDCHMHVFEDEQPTLTGGLPKPSPASLAQYAGLQNRLGTTRFVNVTPSLYGTNNDVLVRSLHRAGPYGRGVAVVDEATGESTLSELHDAGVRGARFNLVQSGTTTPAMIRPVAERVASFGWHIQVHARPTLLLELEPMLTRLPVHVVLDHIASIGDDSHLRPFAEHCVQRLLGSGRVWMKLSAPYFSARDSASYEQLSQTVAKLIERYADRLLWGSDWPHGTERVKPDDAELMDFLLGNSSSHQLEKILVGNPEVVYHFHSR